MVRLFGIGGEGGMDFDAGSSTRNLYGLELIRKSAKSAGFLATRRVASGFSRGT